jgi:hypothetical protein
MLSLICLEKTKERSGLGMIAPSSSNAFLVSAQGIPFVSESVLASSQYGSITSSQPGTL